MNRNTKMIIRLAALLLSLILTTYTTIVIDADTGVEILSLVFTLFSSAWAAGKDNDITKVAKRRKQWALLEERRLKEEQENILLDEKY